MTDFERTYHKAMQVLDSYILRDEGKYADAEDDDTRLSYRWKIKGMKTARQTILKNIELQQLMESNGLTFINPYE